MLASIFGKEALIIRVFEKKQFIGENHTIQEDFLNIFNLKMSDGFVVEQAVYNTSFEGDYLKIKEILNNLPEFKSNKNLLISNMKNIQDEKSLNIITKSIRSLNRVKKKNLWSVLILQIVWSQKNF